MFQRGLSEEDVEILENSYIEKEVERVRYIADHVVENQNDSKPELDGKLLDAIRR